MFMIELGMRVCSSVPRDEQRASRGSVCDRGGVESTDRLAKVQDEQVDERSRSNLKLNKVYGSVAQ